MAAYLRIRKVFVRVWIIFIKGLDGVQLVYRYCSSKVLLGFRKGKIELS